MSDYDNAVEIAERLSDALDRLATATKEAAQLQVAGLLWSGAVDRGTASWQATIETAIDLADGLEAERERRRERAREARRARTTKEARLAEIEARLAENRPADNVPAGDGAPTMRDLLGEERDELVSELCG